MAGKLAAENGTAKNINQSFWRHKMMPHLTVRSTYNSTQGYKAHSHSELSIGLITAGQTLLTLPDNQLCLSAGDIILIDPKVVHSCNPINKLPRSYHMLYLDNHWCCQILSRLYGHQIDRLTCEQYPLIKSAAHRVLISLLDQLSCISNSTNNNVTNNVALTEKIELVLLDIISQYVSPLTNTSDKDSLAYAMKRLLLRDITDSPSLETIAAQLNRPVESLIRQFKARFGITPKAFLTNHRIEQAKLLLKRGMNIVDVAGEVGFSDQSQLHRAFVHYTASTPRQYQQLASIFDNNR